MIQGKWYPKGSASQYSASFEVNGQHYYLQVDGTNELIPTGKWLQVAISDRLGNTERKLTLSDGSVFTTLDNDGIDALLKRDGREKANLWVHKHETKLSSVLMMTVLAVAIVFAFIKWGLPWTSQAVAHALPQRTGEVIGKQSLALIDKVWLTSSQVSEAEQQKIRDRFELRLRPLDTNHKTNYQLHFRNMTMGGVSIPNAFALPSGDIILTDKFVELSQHDDEIDAVLLHEMGHVVHRHSLEMLTESSLTTMIVMLALGNPDGAGELATGLGTALLSNHYSRGHETEADTFAFKKMLIAGINPQAFVDILSRMETYTTTVGADTESEQKQKEREQEIQATEAHTNTDIKQQQPTEDNNQQKQHQQEADFSDFFSTHPSTELRIEMAKSYANCFKQGLTVCD